MSTGTDPKADQKIGETINEITERATLIIREELELARTEVEVKVKSLVRGSVIAAAAGFFVLLGIALLYGHTGALNLAQLGRALAGERPS